MDLSELLDRLLPLAERTLTLWEKWIDRKYPSPLTNRVEESIVWKRGDPIREPQTAEEYRQFPTDQPGRFTRAIESARRERDQG